MLNAVKNTEDAAKRGGWMLRVKWSWKLHYWSWKNHGILFLNFCGIPDLCWRMPEYSVIRGGVDRTVTWPVLKKMADHCLHARKYFVSLVVFTPGTKKKGHSDFIKKGTSSARWMIKKGTLCSRWGIKKGHIYCLPSPPPPPTHTKEILIFPVYLLSLLPS